VSLDDGTFWEAVERIRAEDPRFAREAYGFLLLAVGATVQRLPAERRADPERRHLSGTEVVRGLLAAGRREFGPLAATVFEEWGVRRSEDVGDMVFHLVAAGQLRKRPLDRRSDFARGPDLVAALRGDAPHGAGA
jgi:uncharacterized repeat protein (TIGR04138 family)